tara:strand:- start:785 stop:997 length:213 start_codon:yes stop_codon:yes gene_type:complete
MRKYTFKLEELRTYSVGIDAESETEARKILENMTTSQIAKELSKTTELEEVDVVKGDFFEKPKPKKGKRK